MTPEGAFLDAICATPEDVMPRLMFADWLEERGDEAGRARAEFIRVQCELHGLRCLGATGGEGPYDCYCNNTLCRHCNLDRRAGELLRAYEGAWLDWLKAAWGAEWVPVRECNTEFRRGFVEAVELRTEDWLAHGPVLVRAAPLTSVRLVDREPGSWPPDDPTSFFWHDDRRSPEIATSPVYVPAAIYDLIEWSFDLTIPTSSLHTREAALDALSAAALKWARSAAP